jgi:hypothetical protein
MDQREISASQARQLMKVKVRREETRTAPGRAAEKRFGIRMWEKQHEILWALFNKQKTAIRSCHASGKTYTVGHGVVLYIDAQPSRVLTTAPTNNQVEKLLWAEVNKAFKAALPKVPGRCLTTELKVQPGWDALGFSTDNPLNFQGFHATHFLVAIDEAANVSRAVHDELQTILTSVHSKELLIGNPDDPSGFFAESFEDGKGYYRVKIAAFDTPNFTQFGITYEDFETGDWAEKCFAYQDDLGNWSYSRPLPYPMLLTPDWVADKWTRWGINSPLFIAKVLAEFPPTVEYQLIPTDKLDMAASGEQRMRLLPDVNHGQFGLDVARYGVDRSILIYRQGPRADLMWQFNQYDTVELAEAVRDIVHRVDRDAPIVVDCTGLGAGVADNLKHFGRKVVPYVGNVKAIGDEFANQKAEWYWHLMEEILYGRLTGGAFDDEMVAELKGQKYEYRNGKIKMWKKEKVKEKLGRSPDKSDALMLACAPVKCASKRSMKSRNDLQRKVDKRWRYNPLCG